MREQPSPVRAAIDIGSNTIHIVIARCSPHNLEILEDQVDLVRIGESVTATGEISQQKCDAAIAVLTRYKALAEQYAANPIFVVATEAIRQATNSASFLARVQHETGLTVQLISGIAEATLTFYGATYEVSSGPNPPAQMGVMDLGGGSLELVTAKNMHITWRTSIPIGSGWLHDRYLASNPPTYDELAVAESFLQTYFQGVRIKRRPPVLIVTGGSANSLLYLVHHAFKLEMHQSQLTQRDLIRCQGLLSSLTAEEVSERFQQPLERARILLAGALIIETVMSHLHLNEIHISPHGIREGVLLAYERYGENWLEIVSQSAAFPNDELHADVKPAVSNVKAEEPFAHSGRHMLQERTKKFLEWPKEVLKHEDVEAVHKMRVASRRLRATLDAYESCCDPKIFKKVYRQVKRIADALGAARDADVMLLNLQGQLEHVKSEEQAGMQWITARLEIFRQQKQKQLETILLALDEDKLEKQVESCIPERVASHGKS